MLNLLLDFPISKKFCRSLIVLIVPLIFPSKLWPAIWGVDIKEKSIISLDGIGSFNQTSEI